MHTNKQESVVHKQEGEKAVNRNKLSLPKEAQTLNLLDKD